MIDRVNKPNHQAHFAHVLLFQAAVPALLQTLLLAVNQGVEIQLRIIQTLLLMMTYCPDIHQDVLGEVGPRRITVFRLCAYWCRFSGSC